MYIHADPQAIVPQDPLPEPQDIPSPPPERTHVIEPHWYRPLRSSQTADLELRGSVVDTYTIKDTGAALLRIYDATIVVEAAQGRFTLHKAMEHREPLEAECRAIVAAGALEMGAKGCMRGGGQRSSGHQTSPKILLEFHSSQGRFYRGAGR